MIVQCINLAERTDRRESILAEVATQGLDIQFWPGIIDKIPYKGIAKAHQQIIRWAKESNLPEVTIIEDDAAFTAPDAYQYYLHKKPKTFDLYFGGTYSAEIREGRIMNGFSGLTLYTISKRFYDFALNVRVDWHFDRAMGEWAFDKAYYICEPFIVYQKMGYSDNQRKKVSYETYHKNFKFYKNDPTL